MHKSHQPVQIPKLALTIPVLLLMATLQGSPLAQEIASAGTVALGRKASPYVSPNGLDAAGKWLSVALFAKLGTGYESNVYDAPYYFYGYGEGVTGASSLPNGANMPIADTPLLGVGGIEIASNKSSRHLARLMLAGQGIYYPNETDATVKAFDGFLRYRYMPGRILRLTWDTQVDRVLGQSFNIFGFPDLVNTEDYLHVESAAELEVQTLDPFFVGRGITQLMVSARARDYNEVNEDVRFKRAANQRDTTFVITSFNDTLEPDYYQARARVRHVQGLIRGFSVRGWGDYINRQYTQAWAKRVENKKLGNNISNGSIPEDTLRTADDTIPLGRPPQGYPHRMQHEFRAGVLLQYDPPHVNNVRLGAAFERFWIRDPFEGYLPRDAVGIDPKGFYSYDQWAVRLTGEYTPEPMKYVQFSLEVRNRTYLELTSNYDDWYQLSGAYQLLYHDRFALDSATGKIDSAYVYDKLKLHQIRASIRGQVPLTKYLAIWASGGIDMQASSRPESEYQGRDFFSESVSGGLTVFFRK